MRSPQPTARRADSSRLRKALNDHADELRQACEPLAQRSDEELGAQLLAAAPLQTRPREQLVQWSRTCVDFGRELFEIKLDDLAQRFQIRGWSHFQACSILSSRADTKVQ